MSMHLFSNPFKNPRHTVIGMIVLTSMISTGCTTNYLTNSTQGTYGVPMTERTIPQRLLDRSIEHTAKINIYSLQENLQQNSRMDIDSFNSEVLLTGEVPNAIIKAEIEKVVRSMPDVRQVYNELTVSVARGYSSTVQDSYITSKLVAKVATNDGIKPSQIKAVTNNGIVYIMGRLTPTQQNNLIDIANDTVGVTELVLLTTIVNDRGVVITNDDIMSEPNLTANIAVAADALVATPVVRVSTGEASSNVSPVTVNNDVDNTVPFNDVPAVQESSSPYIELYKDP